MHSNRGFTLVELLAVIAILAILSIVAVPRVIDLYNNAKKDTFLVEVKNMYKSANTLYVNQALKGKTVKNISDDGTYKLSMDDDRYKYFIRLDSKGNVKTIEVSDGNLCLSSNKKADTLTIDDIIDGECTNRQYLISFDKNGGVNGSDEVFVSQNANVNKIDIPTRDGKIFKGYYSSPDTKNISSVINSWASTQRIDMFGNSSWFKTNTDKGRLLVAKLTLTDSNLSSAPTRVEFNDYVISSSKNEYKIVKKSDHSWEYYIKFNINSDMVSKRGIYDYETSYRFFDIEGTTSTTSVVANYIYLDGIKYFDQNGNYVYISDFDNDIDLYAMWE